ncbi:MAG: DMT family transporter, partial [Christensenellaceae bacterium]|nr:DMT family transporter [Christensenellaceae bacterium]
MEKTSRFQKKSVMILTAMLCCLLWGSAFPAIKLTYAELGSLDAWQMLLLAGLRFMLAGAMVLAFGRLRLKIRVLPPRREWPLLLTVAGLQTFLSYVGYYIGMSHVTGVKGSIINSLSVFLVAVFAHFMTGSRSDADRLSWRKVIGLLCGFAGVVVVNITLLSGEVFSFTLEGEGLIVLQCIPSALAIVLVRKYGGEVNSVRLAGGQLAVGGLLLTATGYLGNPRGLNFTVPALFLLVYMAALSAVAFTLWFVMLKYQKASVLEQYR